MNLLFAAVVASLFAAGFYMMMQRSVVRLIFGLVMLSHGANLLIFVSSNPVRSASPLIVEGAKTLPTTETGALATADPLPQALVLTAIVIGFALTAFAAVLVKRVYQDVGTDDPDQMQATER